MAIDIKVFPIRNDEDHARALEAVDALWPLLEVSAEARNAMEVFTVLIDDYERRHHSLGKPSPVEAIKFRMDQLGLKAKDLVPYVGSASRASEVLNEKRGLSLDMIRKLNVGLKIPLDVLIDMRDAPAVPIARAAEALTIDEAENSDAAHLETGIG